MKTLLISLFLSVPLVLYLARITPDPPASLSETSRVEVVSSSIEGGYWLTILRDTETGVEYLSYHHGLVKLEPKPPQNP